MMEEFNENRGLSDIFHEMYLMYTYQGINQRFRANAFRRASRVLRSLPKSISTYSKQELENIPGVGESIYNMILEYLESGKVVRYEKLRKTVPYQLMELMEVKGFGPALIKKMVSQLGVSTKDELISSLTTGAANRISGLGEKKIKDLLRSFKLHKVIEDRLLLWDALKLGDEVLKWLKLCPEVIQAELVGSIRRRKETIGDLDIVACCNEKDRKKVVKHFVSGSNVSRVLIKGDKRASIILKDQNRQVDLQLVTKSEWGSGLHHFTGSKEHNIHLRIIAREKGFRISEHGVFSLGSGDRIAGLTEEEIYSSLKYQWMPPEMREDRGELQLSEKHKIPVLVKEENIRGDLHIHSTWSDGGNTLKELNSHLKGNFNYDYIVISDHSKNARVAKGMDENKLLRQISEIKKLNKQIGRDFIKTGIEVDILKDGTLDFDDEILMQLDWVTAAIHDHFGADNTDRLVRACENPYVCCIAHPTGRMIGYREAYKLDFEAVVKSAAQTYTALEINAQPQRMDLKDELVFEARRAGVKFAIGTDSHSLTETAFMTLGVSIARRAWCKPDDILNTYTWKDIEAFKMEKRKVTKPRLSLNI